MGHGAEGWGWRSASLEVGGVIQVAAVLSSHRASRHVPSASLGQDASLSFVVMGCLQYCKDLLRLN
jgi:hypothetical protein